ncbi:hypothetical protein COOONC_20652 [Cooperia oncophora]
MKQTEYAIIDDIPPDDKLWQEFKDAVRAEGWVNGPDDSVLIILPKLAKSVVAQNKTDGSFIGSVVWCENEGLAYIAFYIILPEYRGFGIGSAIWKRALERIPSDCTIGLRSVERMVHRYKSTDTPIEGQQTFHQRIRVTDLLRIAKSHTLADSTTKLASDLNDREYEEMLSYSNEVCGRDRSHLLRLYFDLDFTEGAILTDSTERIRGFASMTPTGDPDKHLYKISPVYAEGIDEALSVIRPLLVKILKKDPDAIALINTWNNSAGENLRSLLQEHCTESKISGYTLFSKPYRNTMDFSRMFVGHNNSCHFDA